MLHEEICGREENFADLLPHMGNQEAQDAIRAATPELRHCRLLEKNAEACYLCKLECNPYKGSNLRAVVAAKQNAELLNDALDLAQQFELGLLRRAELIQLPPEAATAIAVVRRVERHQLAEAQARSIASTIATILGGAGA